VTHSIHLLLVQYRENAAGGDRGSYILEMEHGANTPNMVAALAERNRKVVGGRICKADVTCLKFEALSGEEKGQIPRV